MALVHFNLVHARCYVWTDTRGIHAVRTTTTTMDLFVLSDCLLDRSRLQYVALHTTGELEGQVPEELLVDSSIQIGATSQATPRSRH